MTDYQVFIAIMALASAATIVLALRREWSALTTLGIAIMAASRVIPL